MKILVFILVVASTVTSAQNAEVDSLWRVWKDPSMEDTARLQALHNYIWKVHLFTNPDSGLHYGKIQEEFAKKAGIEIFEASAINNQGIAFYFKGDYDQALEYYNRSIALNEKLEQYVDAAKTLNNVAVIYNIRGESEKAKETYFKCLETFKKADHLEGYASILVNIGVIYRDEGNYAHAVEYYTKGLQLSEKHGFTKNAVSARNNLATIYQERGEVDLAIKYYDKNYQALKEIGDSKGVATSLNNMGIAYSIMEDHQKAKQKFRSALKLRQNINDLRGIASSYQNLAEVSVLVGQLDSSIYYGKKSLEIATQLKDQKTMTNALTIISSAFVQLEDYKNAIEYGKQAYDIAVKSNLISSIKDAAKNLYLSYKALGNKGDALAMHEMYIQSKDTIESKENEKEIIRQQYLYEYEKREDSIRLEQQKKEEIVNAEQERKEAIAEKKSQKKNMIIWTGAGGLLLVLIFSGIIVKRLRITRKQNRIIKTQKQRVEEAHNEIRDSIKYAKRIQNAILPPMSSFKSALPYSFILYKPKDIVAGDFYWFEHEGSNILFAAADCTGHGVPGAMVSVVCHNAMNRAVREYGLTVPGEILDKTREIVLKEFEKSDEGSSTTIAQEDEIKDGMDIALCSLAIPNLTGFRPGSGESVNLSGLSSAIKLQYAGAHNPLWIIRKGTNDIEFLKETYSNSVRIDTIEDHTFIEIRADKQPIGKYAHADPYATHNIELKQGDVIYIFSDGYADQFGGERGKKFKTSNFKKLLVSICEEPMERQKILLDEAFEEWRGELEQLDDVCVIGVKI